MKSHTFFLCCLTLMISGGSHSRAAVAGAGDIMFTGFNADGTDGLAFVLLNSYDANTVIYFSDNEWDGTIWNSGETYFNWSSAVSLPAGTVITISDIGGTNPISASTGSAVFDVNTNRGLAASNESVYAYLGASFDTPAPVFLSAFANSGFVSAATGILTGTGLTAGSTATAFTNGADILAYTGDRSTRSTWLEYRNLVSATANWIFEDGSGDQHANGIGPDVPFDTTAFSVVPEPAVPVLLASALLAMPRRRVSVTRA